MSKPRRKGAAKNEMMWSMKPGDSITGRVNDNVSGSGVGVSGAPPPPPTPSYPMTSGGLYDLDTLDEELVTATAPSSSAYQDVMEPKLDNLRSLNKSKATFKEMLRAAGADAANHAVRMRKFNESEASGGGGGSGSRETSTWIERVERRKKWDAKSDALKKEAAAIVRLIDTPTEGTQAEVAKERLARWQRALELYVHCPEESGVNLLKLLEKLIEGCGEEDELLEALSQASQTCTSLVDQTSLAVRDATHVMAEAEDAYHIKLEAHTMLANRAADQSEKIEEQFRTNGRAALKIGQQLEMAEAKKRQCDTASLLIRQWWMMENLAEQEELSGEALQVNEEVRGAIPSSSCRMDPLFTRSENSLEAARALKALRTVVKSRGNSASGALLDPVSRHRFDVTSRLIQRTSAALEARLIESFSEIYAAGGTYDFSSPEAATRQGRLNWIELRNLAMALSNFDGGRGLHKRYVQMVITSRFPELFQKGSQYDQGDDSDSNEDSDDEQLDMDSMRQKLSNLFHRVCEVCTAEFQLIANVFSSPATPGKGGDATFELTSLSDAIPFQVARALLQRVISDPHDGLQARINDLLDSIDRRGDFDAGTKKLDTFVVIHEKAAGLFTMLKDSAQTMLIPTGKSGRSGDRSSEEYQAVSDENARAVASLIQFLTTQEMSLSSSHRRGYLNLELRLLHHECCYCLDRTGAKLVMPQKSDTARHNTTLGHVGGPATYVAPDMPLDKQHLKKVGFAGLLNGPLKPTVLRQPLMHATDSLARARLMFGVGQGGFGDMDSTARVITGIFSQLCTFYGSSFLFPIIEVLGNLLDTNPPSAPPNLPFDEMSPAPDLGVDGSFWVGIERIHSAAKAFDRELWAEQRAGSERVWEILVATGSHTVITLAKDLRMSFFQELEEMGETAILRALDTISTHIQWVLVAGGENVTKNRVRHNFSDKSGGPYAVPAGSSLENANSPAVKSLTFCLRAQFVHIQAALTPQSLSAFWTALSMRLYDILVTRLLQHYYISMVGAVKLSRDVEALRSVAMLAGTDHQHWDQLRELLTVYMTPPNALKTILVGPEGDPNSGKGLFGQAGKVQALVFMSRRIDYRVKINNVFQKSTWVVELLEDLGVPDPTDGAVNIALYSAQSLRNRRLKLS
eukprot:CAMPEP_0201923060 /NCGR_PEP_ID=MMETSP0903-20130614/10915_1 /ASSEMBLY_ACC=CAM_ASM_000552 /TAXON_ID=420261 /ORGANISM="Thalassiosira antarctica, Strain CCMP982" /LENGTH=1141 /DNA_ID=CAMNT_0048460305 /DNA_START=90 /DNA_END=3515 /DNA_ORIENTATION=+